MSKLAQLSITLPDPLRSIAARTLTSLDNTMRSLPWVLTHDDLSDMNLLVESKTGRLTGVVDWADVIILPFGVALWGLESVLGRSGSGGWSWPTKKLPHHRQLFHHTFSKEIGGLSAKQCESVGGVRVLGILLRYGFNWKNGAIVPTNDTGLLSIFLGCKCNGTDLDSDIVELIAGHRLVIYVRSVCQRRSIDCRKRAEML